MAEELYQVYRQAINQPIDGCINSSNCIPEIWDNLYSGDKTAWRILNTHHWYPQHIINNGEGAYWFFKDSGGMRGRWGNLCPCHRYRWEVTANWLLTRVHQINNPLHTLL